MSQWLEYLFGGAVLKVVFLALAIGGAIFSVIGILFGGHGDTDGHDADGHGDHGGGDHGHGHDGHGDGPSYLGLRGVMMFITGFGAGGYLAYHFTEKPLLSSMVGVLAGIAVDVPAIWLIRRFWSMQSSSTLSGQDFQGVTGTVTTAIPGNGPGEVVLRVRDTLVTKAAVSEDRSPLAQGTPVTVVNYLGNMVVVRAATAGAPAVLPART